MALSMLALLGSLAFTAPAADEVASPAMAEEVESRGLLTVKVKRNGATLKHPGHMIETGEEIVLVLKKGNRTHEVTVFVEKGEGGYTFEVAYTDNGSVVLTGVAKAKPKQWVKLKSENGKSWVELQLDPSKKRRDGVDIPDGNDPLDGLK